MSNTNLESNVISIGYRNQYDGNIGYGSEVSCLRSSLSFLHLIFNNGLDSALTADGIDGALIEAQVWTKDSTKKGQKPSMCSIVELPNKISYKNFENSLCCVFSRVYGECGFYTMPGDGFQSTQIPARNFFVDVWGKRSESFALVIIGSLGLGIYRNGDTVYIFDPHGHGNVSQAFIVKLSASDIYTYLAGYACIDPESQWSGAMVFFVSSGPNQTTVEDLSNAVSFLYGVSETYLVDETYIEKRVFSAHPMISGPSSQTSMIVGKLIDSTEDSEQTISRDIEAITREDFDTSSIWATEFEDCGSNVTGLSSRSGNQTNSQQNINLKDVVNPLTEKRLSLPKRRRPVWTPPTSSEDLTVNSTHTPAGKPTQKYRNKQKSLNVENLDNTHRYDKEVVMEDQQLSEHTDYCFLLKNRKPLILENYNTPYEFNNSMHQVEFEFKNLEAHTSQLDDLSIKCIDSTVWVTKHLSFTNNYDPLEHFLIIIFERLLTFLIENGAKTRSDIPSVIEPLFSPIISSIPIHTTSIDFIQSTRMILQDIPKHKSLFKLVINDNSIIGSLAISKLRLVAKSVYVSTEKLNKELDEMESDLKGGVNPLGLYNHLSKRLMEFMDKQPEKMFCKKSDGYDMSLFKRVGDLFRRARTKEMRATQSNITLAKNLIALESAVHKSHETFDAIEVQPNNITIDNTEINNIKILDPLSISNKISKVIEKSETIVNDAIREYFLRGAQYSARAILMDKSSGLRFQVAAASVENLERLLESLPILDKSIQSLSSSTGVQHNQNIHSVSSSRKASLLRELIRAGKDLSTDNTLGEWVSLLSEAQTGGHIDKRELENLIKDINQINDRAQKVSSMENELSLFRVLSSAVEQAANDSLSSDPTSIDTLIRGAEDMLKQAKVLDGYIATGKLSKEVRSQIETRKMEVETLIRSSKQQLQEINNQRNIIYDQLKNILLPLAGFVGLRAAPGIIKKMVKDTCSETAINFRNIVFKSPNSVLATVHSHLWSLFNQYREALEHPNTTTASALAGLGYAFSAVIETVLDTNQYYILFDFFLHHADALSESIGLATIDTDSEHTIKKTIDTIENAIKAVTENGVVNNDFKFLLSLRDKYDKHICVLGEIQRLRNAQKVIMGAISTAVDVISKLRSVNVSTDDSNNIDMIISHTQNVLSDISTASTYGSLEISNIDKNGLSSPAINKDYQELKKMIDSVNQKITDINESITNINNQRKTLLTNYIHDKWRKDMQAVLEKIETQCIFDVSELTRLRDIAAANSYDTREFYKQAEKAISSKMIIATNTIEEILKFNPYAPENINMEVNPTISLLRNITWWDEFAVVAPVLSTLFSGVDIESMMRLLRISTNIITFANINGGKFKYYDVITHISQDLIQIPTLARYVEFYRKGYIEFEDERERLSSLRADVFQANGSRSAEINRALEEVTYVRNLDDATKILESGVYLHIPGDKMIDRAIDYLEKFDKLRFKGSAYENIINVILNRDLSNARDSLLQAKLMREEATKRAITILREVVEVSKSRDRDDLTNLTNLKTLLRLTPPPPTMNNAIEKATSADELVTQAALLLQTVEEERELDVKAVEWLQQCRSIIDSHPFTVRIDGKGPMEPYAERIEKLHNLRKELDDLKVKLSTAEIAWDEEWNNFEKESQHVNASQDAFFLAKDCSRSLQASMSVVLGLRASEIYRRLSTKITGNIDTKYVTRNKSLEQFYNLFHDIEQKIGKFEALLSKIPPEVDFDNLNLLLSEFDKYTTSLPKWVSKKYSSYKELINLRLNLYKEYQKLTKNQFFSKPSSLITMNLNTKTVEDENRRICGRVSALMGDKDVIYTLQEAKPNIDALFQKCYLDSNGVPIDYRLCYKTVGEKLAVMLCGSLGKSMRPVVSNDPLIEFSSVAGIHIMSEILQLRLGFEKARSDNFSTFSRFIRHKRQDWTSDQRSQMMAELYSAVIATTITRQLGTTWHKIKFSLNDGNFTSINLKKKGSDQKNLLLTLSDVMIILVAHCPMHLVNFLRLDLIRQHEYMSKTVLTVLTEALSSKILINTLDANVNVNQMVPLQMVVDPNDISHGRLFSIRNSDWKITKISSSNLLDIWVHSPDDCSRECINNVIKLIPGNALITFTVLARMCIPPNVLSSLWTTLRSDILDQENISYDDMVTSRLDTVTTIQTTTSTVSNNLINIKSDFVELYDISGTSTTFTITETPPKVIENVNAMDIVTCAILLGAPIVVAMENQDVFSTESGLSICMKLFDFREGASDFNVGSAISSDLSSWGNTLLSYDPNIIENLCLNSQLEQLSGLIASKPLSSTQSFLLILDSKSNINKILWSQNTPHSPTIISFAEDEIISELPFIEVDEDFLPEKNQNDPIYTKVISGNNIPDMSIEGSICTEFPEYMFSESNLFPYSFDLKQPTLNENSDTSDDCVSSTNSNLNINDDFIVFDDGESYEKINTSPIVGDWEEWLKDNFIDIENSSVNNVNVSHPTSPIQTQSDEALLVGNKVDPIITPKVEIETPLTNKTATTHQPAERTATTHQPAERTATTHQPKTPIKKYTYIKPSLGPFKYEDNIQTQNNHEYEKANEKTNSSDYVSSHVIDNVTPTNVHHKNEFKEKNNTTLQQSTGDYSNSELNKDDSTSPSIKNDRVSSLPDSPAGSDHEPEDISLPDSPAGSDHEPEDISRNFSKSNTNNSELQFTNDEWDAPPASGNQHQTKYYKPLVPPIPTVVLHTKIRQTPRIKNHRFRKSYDKFSKFSKSGFSNSGVLSTKDKPKTKEYETTKTNKNNQKDNYKHKQIKTNVRNIKTEAESQELDELYKLYENTSKTQPIKEHINSQYENEDNICSSDFENDINQKYSGLGDETQKFNRSIFDEKLSLDNTTEDDTTEDDSTASSVKKYNTYDNFEVSWDQHLVPTSPFNSELTSPNMSDTDVTDNDTNNSDDNESVILKPSKRVINSDDLLGRRYFRNTSLSALSLLIAACHLIKKRLRNTRELLVDRQRNMILELHKISIILG
ncbi:large tegument protein-like protein [Phocid alphaherpesvirus 1]|uniref:Large tegument protein-like protein n=1 Tax=Phocid alphaherpesvirus 1 TaxID=47418 RepID=A0A482F3J5_9ALPH|nr:large tegument protein-like protein [Phocid alphaherpesvirus 1]QBN85157.1 large tegument protein-like protein [Phocid alphaherpesvirus 1]